MGFRGAFARFFAESGFFLGAGLAFFFLVTVIPLLLLGAATLGFVLSSEAASREVVAQVTRNFPVYRREISAAILRIVETRAVSGIAGTFILIFFSTPLFGAQSLLADVQAGDRMDIIALFPPAPNLPARSAVIVRGATVVVRPTVSSGTPIVFAVSPEESLVIAHLVEGGVSLTYSLWPETGAPALEPTNVANARARLGLDRPTATPTSTAASLPPAENPPPSPPEQAP